MLQLYAEYGTNSGSAFHYKSCRLIPGSWVQVSLAQLGVANVTNLNRFDLQLTASGSAGTFYVDDVQLTAESAPGGPRDRDSTKVIRQTEPRWYGVNTAVWDGNFDTSTTVSLLREMGIWPSCGSRADPCQTNTTLPTQVSPTLWHWSTSFGNFINVATNVASQAFITVNYGTGPPPKRLLGCARRISPIG